MPVQTTSPSDYPQAVIQQIERLAQNIVIARKRRKETQAQWAKRLGVSQPTMARIERGDPAVAMATYVMCLWLINPAAALSDLIAPSQDTMALEHEVTRALAYRPKRASKTPKLSTVPTMRANAPLTRARWRQGEKNGSRLRRPPHWIWQPCRSLRAKTSLRRAHGTMRCWTIETNAAPSGAVSPLQ